MLQMRQPLSMAIRAPEAVLNTTYSREAEFSARMPSTGLGIGGVWGFDATKAAVLNAIKIGYRHIDAAFVYGSDKAVGAAVAEALRDGVLKSRHELFITSKLWCTFSERNLVVTAIKKSLENLQMEYLDLYLVEFPLKLSPVARNCPYPGEFIQPIDVKSVWEGMEECQRLGLAKSIGVSHCSIQALQQILQFATIPPAVNLVNPMWQQKEMNEFCKEKGIHITAYSPLGAYSVLGANETAWGEKRILSSDALHLQEIAQARGKIVAQASGQKTGAEVDEDILKKAHEIYYAQEKKRFKYEHVWRLLRDEPVWIDYMTKNNHANQRSDTPTSDSDNEGDSDDEDISDTSTGDSDTSTGDSDTPTSMFNKHPIENPIDIQCTKRRKGLASTSCDGDLEFAKESACEQKRNLNLMHNYKMEVLNLKIKKDEIKLMKLQSDGRVKQMELLMLLMSRGELSPGEEALKISLMKKFM